MSFCEFIESSSSLSVMTCHRVICHEDAEIRRYIKELLSLGLHPVGIKVRVMVQFCSGSLVSNKSPLKLASFMFLPEVFRCFKLMLWACFFSEGTSFILIGYTLYAVISYYIVKDLQHVLNYWIIAIKLVNFPCPLSLFRAHVHILMYTSSLYLLAFSISLVFLYFHKIIQVACSHPIV